MPGRSQKYQTHASTADPSATAARWKKCPKLILDTYIPRLDSSTLLEICIIRSVRNPFQPCVDFSERGCLVKCLQVLGELRDGDRSQMLKAWLIACYCSSRAWLPLCPLPAGVSCEDDYLNRDVLCPRIDVAARFTVKDTSEDLLVEMFSQVYYISLFVHFLFTLPLKRMSVTKFM